MTTPIHHTKTESSQEHKPTDEKKPPAPFEKKSFKKKWLPKGVSNETLRALKALIEKHKVDEEVAGTGLISFGNTTARKTEVNQEAAKIGKLEPSSQVMQLFAKLAESLVHLDKSGIKETTITLGKAFTTSIFNQAKIIITEYSTAPKIYNIQFTASPEAVNFFEPYALNLKTTLNGGNFNFSIHQVDTSIMSDWKNNLIEAITEKEDNA